MKRFKAWLYDKFLPMWAKETLLEDNKRVLNTNRELSQEIKRLQAYIDGLERGIKAQRKTVINNEVRQ